MMVTTSLSTSSPLEPLESTEFILITDAGLREQLLRARLHDDFCTRSIIQRGESVYLSLREVPEQTQKNDLSWAILRLQMGAQLNPEEVPEPLRTALSAHANSPSPLILALLWGSLVGVIGGVLIMAIIGLIVTIINFPTDSYISIMATAVAFVLSGAFIGVGMTIYFWRIFTRQTAVPVQRLLRQRL